MASSPRRTPQEEVDRVRESIHLEGSSKPFLQAAVSTDRGRGDTSTRILKAGRHLEVLPQ